MTEGRPMTEDAVETFLNKLAAADADKKVDQIQFFGLSLEDASSLPESTLDALTGCAPPLLRSSSTLLVTSVLTSFLPVYFPLLPATGHHIRLALTTILPALIEKLNDQKDRISAPARKCVVALGRRCYESEGAGDSSASNGSLKGKEKAGQEGPVTLWERNMSNVFAGKAWRGKVEGIRALEELRTEMGSKFSLKPWLSVLAELLEDGDSNVRDQARETSVSLLSPSSMPNGARAEFKRLMEKYKVRKAIAEPIWERIMRGSPVPDSNTADSDRGSRAPTAAASEGSLRSGAATPAVGAQADDIAPVYIASIKDLENEFARMIPFFEGKETEQNWLPREKAVMRVRGMLRGQVHSQYRETFLAGLKAGMMAGIAKTMASLRTTVAQHSCFAVQELAESLGQSFDPLVEGLLPSLWKMGGFTKKIIADRSQRAVSAIIIHSAARAQLFVAQLSSGVVDKNVQLRHYSSQHMKTFLDVQASKHKSSVDSSPGLLDQISDAIEKSLADVNPQVRDLARAAFWSFSSVWPQRASIILGKLDPTARKLLDKANPRTSAAAPSARPSMGAPSTAAPAKKPSSNMSALLAEKRRAAAKLAAEKGNHESPRVVSGPVPGSPSLGQGMPRSSSSNILSSGHLHRQDLQTESTLNDQDDEGFFQTSRPAGSPARQVFAQDNGAISRSSSFGQPASSSPESPNHAIPSSTATPSRPLGVRLASGIPSPSTSTPSRAPLRHAASGRKSLLSSSGPGSPPTPKPSTQESGVLASDLTAQAAQAEQAAMQLLDFEDPSTPPALDIPATPARSAMPALKTDSMAVTPLAFKTPARSAVGLQGWEDSPRNLAVTPQMLENLKGRRTERSWWLRQRQLMDQASPAHQPASQALPDGGVEADVQALADGRATSRTVQRLSLFATSHPIADANSSGGSASDENRKLWEKDQLFERIFDGLMDFLQPSQDTDDLLQGMVLLWEMVQKQWVLFEDHEPPLVDALFRLRACTSVPILESTNSLISLLSETSEPILLLSVIRDRLAQTSPGQGAGVDEGIQARTTLFGLNGMGMCILRLPREVVLVEAKTLEPFIMEAQASPTVSVRQGGQTLLLAVQAVLMDSQLTLSFFPRLSTGAKDLAVYFFEKNGLLNVADGGLAAPAAGPDEAAERKEKVLEEVVGSMARGVAL